MKIKYKVYSFINDKKTYITTIEGKNKRELAFALNKIIHTYNLDRDKIKLEYIKGFDKTENL